LRSKFHATGAPPAPEQPAERCAAFAPYERRRGDFNCVLRLEIAHLQPAAVDPQRTVGVPGRGDLSGFQIEVGRAGHEVAGIGQLDARLAVHHHVERPEQAERRKVSGNARRHEILNQSGDGEALAPRLLDRAHLELPVALGGGDIGLADKNAARVMMLEIDGEVGHLP
jgi:hypothetical protein